MDRLWESGAVANPPQNKGTSRGYPQDGTNEDGVATIPGAYWYFAVSESIIRAIEAAGLVPDHANMDQLGQAIVAIAKSGGGQFLPLSGGQLTGPVGVNNATQAISVFIPNTSAGTLPGSDKTSELVFSDASQCTGDTYRYGRVRATAGADGSSIFSIGAYKNGTETSIGVKVENDGSAKTFAPTPPLSDNSTQIATTNFVAGTVSNALETSLESYMPKAGGTLTGALTFDNGKTIGDYLPLSGGKLTGEIEFSPNQKLPSGLVIGQIVESVLPLTDAGLHLLDGAKLPATGMYAAFYAHCQTIQASHPSLFVSESNWQSTFSTYGSCGKFVLDSDGVRLPSISNIVQGTSDVSQLGALVEAGLPSPTVDASHSHSLPNQLTRYDGDINHTLTGGPSAIKTGETWTRTSSNTNTTNLTLVATNSVYGNSETVQPQTIKVLLYICVANNTKSDVVVDIDRVATDLNGKLDRDLSNVIGNAVERVSDSSTFSGGGWVRYESGVQICWGRTSNTSWRAIAFPVPFFGDTPSVTLSVNYNSEGMTYMIQTNVITLTDFGATGGRRDTGNRTTDQFPFSWFAIGRWK